MKKVYLSLSAAANSILVSMIIEFLNKHDIEVIRFEKPPYDFKIIDPADILMVIPPDGQFDLVGKGSGSEVEYALRKEKKCYIVTFNINFEFHSVTEVVVANPGDWKKTYFRLKVEPTTKMFENLFS